MIFKPLINLSALLHLQTVIQLTAIPTERHPHSFSYFRNKDSSHQTYALYGCLLNIVFSLCPVHCNVSCRHVQLDRIRLKFYMYHRSCEVPLLTFQKWVVRVA